MPKSNHFPVDLVSLYCNRCELQIQQYSTTRRTDGMIGEVLEAIDWLRKRSMDLNWSTKFSFKTKIVFEFKENILGKVKMTKDIFNRCRIRMY